MPMPLMLVPALLQMLDGLQYLHWRGVAHLNLQPDNVVLASCRRLSVKLVDLGSAQRVSRLGRMVRPAGHVEFTGEGNLASHNRGVREESGLSHRGVRGESGLSHRVVVIAICDGPAPLSSVKAGITRETGTLQTVLQRCNPGSQFTGKRLSYPQRVRETEECRHFDDKALIYDNM